MTNRPHIGYAIAWHSTSFLGVCMVLVDAETWPLTVTMVLLQDLHSKASVLMPTLNALIVSHSQTRFMIQWQRLQEGRRVILAGEGLPNCGVED